MYRRKKRYYMLVDSTENGKRFLLKEYRKFLWFFIPIKNTKAFWVDEREFNKYEEI